MGLTPGAGLSKESVNYRPFERCKTCNYFYNPGSCEIVQGNISSDGLCDKWEMGEKEEEGKDGDFYQKEYAKTEGK